MGNTVNESAIKKLKLLFTVVDRPKQEFYLDVLSQFEVNLQMVVAGKGTATSELVDMLGLNIHKATIIRISFSGWMAMPKKAAASSLATPLALRIVPPRTPWARATSMASSAKPAFTITKITSWLLVVMVIPPYPACCC